MSLLDLPVEETPVVDLAVDLLLESSMMFAARAQMGRRDLPELLSLSAPLWTLDPIFVFLLMPFILPIPMLLMLKLSELCPLTPIVPVFDVFPIPALVLIAIPIPIPDPVPKERSVGVYP